MTRTQKEPFVGQVIPTRQWTVSPDMVRFYRDGLAVDHRDAVPHMVANGAEGFIAFSQQRGHLWLRQEWEFHKPLTEGATYSVESEVVDIYPRRDRTIILSEVNVRDSDNEMISTQRHHQSFLLDNPPDVVQLRDPSSKEGHGKVLPQMITELASIERKISLEMCGEFFYGSKSYHSDKAASAELGFTDVVVGGRMTMGYVGELLETTLGDRWTRSGRLLVKFTNVVWPDDTIRVTVGLGGPSEEDPTRDIVLARVEKADGTVAIVAEGSVDRE